MGRPPSVDRLARSIADVGLPHPLLVEAARAAIADGSADDAREHADRLARTLLQRVVNATGVLLHTNLGRAPLAHHQEAGYSNLELDLASGQRGSRSAHTAALVARACGAESALVVNNGAGAVLLVLAALARDRGVAVSRGELVEIGGGFRVPEVMVESGAQLVEVGTTNRTRLEDYRTAVEGGDLALLLKVHQSNYRIVGFTESVEVADLAGLGPPLAVDLGSGLLDGACPWLDDGPPEWLRHEPAARQTLEDGAAVVTFSGDKLLGGPQAGIIAGRADLVERCAAHPLARALRPGSLVLAALQEIALAYLSRHAGDLPLWRMATIPVEDLRARGEAIGGVETDDVTYRTSRSRARPAWPGNTEVVDTLAVPGGGTLPGIEIPSVGLALPGDHTGTLRDRTPPILGRVQDGRTILDLRTVDPADDGLLADAIRALG